MVRYEEKFIVVNRKHLSEVEQGLLKEFLLKCDVPDNKYYVCNQDEPYSKEVIKIILEGEDAKV